MGALRGTNATRTSSSSMCRVLVRHFQISSLPPRLVPCPSAFSPNQGSYKRSSVKMCLFEAYLPPCMLRGAFLTSGELGAAEAAGAGRVQG